MGPRVVFIHGTDGPEPREKWLTPLNEALRRQGYLPVDRAQTVNVDYAAQFHSPVATTPQAKRSAHLSPADLERYRRAYHIRREELKAVLRRHMHRRRRQRWLAGARIPEPGDLYIHGRHALGRGVREVAPQFEQAETYRKNARVRHAIQASVLDQLPQEDDLIVIAHSLGSQVAADLLPGFQPGQRIRLLLTIGSPLSATGLLGYTVAQLQPFPYASLGCWVNVHGRWDWVTGGKGISRRVRPVLDVPVSRGAHHLGHHAHGLRAYCAHPATAAAVGYSLYGSHKADADA